MVTVFEIQTQLLIIDTGCFFFTPEKLRLQDHVIFYSLTQPEIPYSKWLLILCVQYDIITLGSSQDILLSGPAYLHDVKVQ